MSPPCDPTEYTLVEYHQNNCPYKLLGDEKFHQKCQPLFAVNNRNEYIYCVIIPQVSQATVPRCFNTGSSGIKLGERKIRKPAGVTFQLYNCMQRRPQGGPNLSEWRYYRTTSQSCVTCNKCRERGPNTTQKPTASTCQWTWTDVQYPQSTTKSDTRHVHYPIVKLPTCRYRGRLSTLLFSGLPENGLGKASSWTKRSTDISYQLGYVCVLEKAQSKIWMR